MIRSKARLTDVSNDSSDSVLLSESCIKRLKKISKNPDDYLRLTVDGGGCSGFQYNFRFENQIKPDDHIIEKEGVKVVVDETSIAFIRGSTIDYHEELIRSTFRVVSNPNAEQGCSCGASFALK
ncbi:PREDICTED: iron-sulfur cluster assembly 2 homolog, mitochondrial-like [Priapulus caudatus]|uniref:Iron-sulfur cluster assembly 2 homolog, mitochondrial-like n=1 Tax=Priapulus caudatus TaxID=37621 RepID=A0ABM1EFJ4_PRICU|nr:PREDICTED: iron-sulfur cluster assembly 2 homolog, mitochondrial-like [Priapulus caudatus]